MEFLVAKGVLPGFIGLLLVLVMSGIFYICQAVPVIKTEGVYPAVRPLTEAHFDFGQDLIEVKLVDPPSINRIVVFAYDGNGRQVAIIKPVTKGIVTIVPGDAADYRVNFKEPATVKDYEILRESHDAKERVDFFRIITEAKGSLRRYGMQECLYPVCTRCMEVCPVIKVGVIQMLVNPKGAFYPVIHLEGCPRSGLCFAVCKVDVIIHPSKMSKKIPGNPTPSDPIQMPTEEDLKTLFFGK
jgi:NAD-dependent dihydropyrimidine dehydrogenase PreA subunit